MDQIQLAIELLSKGQSTEAISILSELRTQPSPPRLANLIFAVALEGLPFKFLSYIAAKTEEQLHQSPEATNLIGNLENQSRQGRSRPITGLPKISLIGIATQANINKWNQCIESLLFQHYINIELCLACNEKLSLTVPNFVKIITYTGNVLDGYEAAINASSAEIISILEYPSSIFSDEGLGAVATTFHTKQNINVAQTERLYLSNEGLPSSMRHNFPHWDQQTLLNRKNLDEPTHHFCWQGVFFSKKIIQQHLPFNRQFPDSSGFEIATRIIRNYDFHLAPYSAIVSKFDVRHKTPVFPLKQISDAVLIIDAEKRITKSPRSTPRLSLSPIQKSDSIPIVSPQILIKGKQANTKITIVTASYNCADYIEECIDSILNQNYPNLEYIILDGASTDGTKEKILCYQKYLSYFNSAPDAGHYAAIQTGFNQSTGNVLTWLNADDMLCPYSLELVSYLFSTRPDIHWISGQHANIDESKIISINKSQIKFSAKRYIEGEFDNPFIQQEGTFWTRDLWQKSGGSLDLRLSLAADMELWTRFFQHQPLYSLNIPLGIFRKRSGQRSDIFRQEYYCEAIATTDRLKINNAIPIDDHDKELLLEF